MSREIHVRFREGLGVRFPRATRLVIGFEREADARACLTALAERFEKFGLRLHPDKTRLIEFGRGSAARRKREGRGKCETFDFLGFTHICSRTRNGKRFAAADHHSQAVSSHARSDKAEAASTPPLDHWVRRTMACIGLSRLAGIPRSPQQLPPTGAVSSRRYSTSGGPNSADGVKGAIAGRWERMQRTFDKHIPPARITHPWPATRHHARLRARAV